MAVHFSQTLHALNSERERSWIALGLASILLILWVMWFFMGRITHLAYSESVEVTLEAQPVWRMNEGRVTPYRQYQVDAVIEEDIAEVQVGQVAIVTLSGDSTLPLKPIKSYITDVDKAQNTVSTTFEVDTLLEKSIAIDFAVEIDSQSPASYLFHLTQ
ncbi:hypothetical protein BET10_14005 [Pseudoalteromonas amylolytica]|uniref:Uncharacterized protein n=2 Tax=Pseudoalteromonas TaxID=53246 RepID=A0A1S1MRZ7_9GAMM|nr:hypothetical protein BFC16_20970 [Pseudoalteromonas sp. JW3]OHU89903.1 hypothetical protein BET10_14005 [Pseudoalteromonas amylolytica]